MAEIVETKPLGTRECPLCRRTTLSHALEIWFGTFSHTEKKCQNCGFYSYT